MTVKNHVNLMIKKVISMPKREFKKRNLGAAVPGNFVIWHNDPTGAVKIPVTARPDGRKESI